MTSSVFSRTLNPTQSVNQTEAYHRTKWHLDPSSRLGTIDMGRKSGGSAPFLGR